MLLFGSIGAVVALVVGSDDEVEARSVGRGAREYDLDLGERLAAPGGEARPGHRLALEHDDRFVILAAPIDTEYALRVRRGGAWDEAFVLAAELDEGPDGPAGLADPSLERPERTVAGEGPESEVLAVGPFPVAGADLVEIVALDDGVGAITTTVLSDGFGAAPNEAGTPSVAGRQIAAGVAPPAIRSRSAWTGDGWASSNSGCSDGPWYADNIAGLIVHHTVTPNGYDAASVPEMLRAILYSHVRVNGWCDVGYNFLVDRFGTIWEGRVGGIDLPVIGGHAKGFNTSTIGVAMLGQHQPGARPTVARPTAATDEAIKALATWKLGLHGVDPEGETWLKNRSSRGPQRHASQHWHLVPTVMGHRHVGVTSCPGNHGLDLVRAMVDELVVRRPSATPYRFDGWAAADVGVGVVTVDARGGLRPGGSMALPGMGEPLSPGQEPAVPADPRPLAVGAARFGTRGGGWTLAADGTLAAFGAAPAMANDRPTAPAAAVDVTAARSGDGGWVVSTDGAVLGFGARPNLPVAASVSGAPVIRGAIDPAGDGGYLLERDGRLRAVGAAGEQQLTTGPVEARDIAVRPGADGGWVLAADGTLHAFGRAKPAVFDTPEPTRPSGELVAITASASGNGGWALASDGSLWPFGGERLVSPWSGDVARRDLIDLAAVDPAVPASFVAGSTGRYLDAVVRLFLDRPATPAEIDYWAGRLTYGDGRADVTTALARSDEWAGRRIDEMYTQALGRPADAEGRAYWVGEVADGLSLQRVGVSFYGSAEYFASAGSARAFVTLLYDVLLGRAVDADGLQYWSGELEAGRAAPNDVAAGFYTSPESRRRRVIGLYREVLGRDPDQGGLDYWAERLLAVDDVVLAAELATSDEFHANATR